MQFEMVSCIPGVQAMENSSKGGNVQELNFLHIRKATSPILSSTSKHKS